MLGKGNGSSLLVPGLLGMGICCFLANWPDQPAGQLVVPERGTGQNRILRTHF